MSITALPTPPQRSDPTNFPVRADAFMASLPTFVTEANALQADVNSKQSSAATSATAASTSATAAATNATNAATSATAASTSATAAASSAASLSDISTSTVSIGVGSIVFTVSAGKQFTVGVPIIAIDSSNSANFVAGKVLSYSSTTLTIDVSTLGGSGSHSNWNISVCGVQGVQGPVGIASLLRSTRTSNTNIVAADMGTLIDITSGTFTQTFSAAVTLGVGWWAYIKNSGTGDITLDPNASELIDGLTSYVMYPSEVRLIQCSGSTFNTIVIQPFTKKINSTMTFVTPPGYSILEGLAWGGGQSGQKSGGAGDAIGGFGGGCGPFSLPVSTVSASFTITIGAGGVASTTADSNAGGNTTIGSYFTIYPGVATGAIGNRYGGSMFSGIVPTTSSSGFEAGKVTSVATDSSGKTVYGGAGASNTNGVPCGWSIYGGGAGGSVISSTLQAAGTSTFGGSGGAASSASSGVDGSVPSGGGGATQTGTQSGAGGAGQVIISGR